VVDKVPVVDQHQSLIVGEPGQNRIPGHRGRDRGENAKAASGHTRQTEELAGNGLRRGIRNGGTRPTSSHPNCPESQGSDRKPRSIVLGCNDRSGGHDLPFGGLTSHQDPATGTKC
jgi:hypothetical protein